MTGFPPCPPGPLGDSCREQVGEPLPLTIQARRGQAPFPFPCWPRVELDKEAFPPGSLTCCQWPWAPGLLCSLYIHPHLRHSLARGWLWEWCGKFFC